MEKMLSRDGVETGSTVALPHIDVCGGFLAHLNVKGLFALQVICNSRII